jgi:hypothetical protein
MKSTQPEGDLSVLQWLASCNEGILSPRPQNDEKMKVHEIEIGDAEMKTLKRSQEEMRYAQLWAEIEVPKILKGDEGQ